MKILLIRLRLIGDVVFTTPAVAAVRARFPDARLTYLVEPAAEPVIRHNPHVNEVMRFTMNRRAEPGKAYEEEFSFGLELILDGLTRTLQKRRGSG